MMQQCDTNLSLIWIDLSIFFIKASAIPDTDLYVRVITFKGYSADIIQLQYFYNFSPITEGNNKLGLLNDKVERHLHVLH